MIVCFFSPSFSPRGNRVDAFVVVSGRGTTKACRSFVSYNSKNKDNDDDSYYDPRDNLGRELRGLQSTGLKQSVEPGDTVFCKKDIQPMGIYEGKAYELQAIYAQAFQESTQTVDKIALGSLDTEIPPGYDRYITLYNPMYQDEPVVVTPDEVGLVSVRSELVNSMWLAIPGFFWVFVASSFYNIYHERTGGSFLDAFLGR